LVKEEYEGMGDNDDNLIVRDKEKKRKNEK